MSRRNFIVYRTDHTLFRTLLCSHFVLDFPLFFKFVFTRRCDAPHTLLTPSEGVIPRLIRWPREVCIPAAYLVVSTPSTARCLTRLFGCYWEKYVQTFYYCYCSVMLNPFRISPIVLDSQFIWPLQSVAHNYVIPLAPNMSYYNTQPPRCVMDQQGAVGSTSLRQKNGS